MRQPHLRMNDWDDRSLRTMLPKRSLFSFVSSLEPRTVTMPRSSSTVTSLSLNPTRQTVKWGFGLSRLTLASLHYFIPTRPPSRSCSVMLHVLVHNPEAVKDLPDQLPSDLPDQLPYHCTHARGLYIKLLPSNTSPAPHPTSLPSLKTIHAPAHRSPTLPPTPILHILPTQLSTHLTHRVHRQ